MRILLTNDDGITAPGLAAMYRQLSKLGEVVVVAPFSGQSAMSHAVTFHKPMSSCPMWLRTDLGDTIEGIAVDGKPADCVKLAVNHMLNKLGGPVDLVVSGMNAGCNVGICTLYSGTVGAAVEGAIQGLPSVAVSLHLGKRENVQWDLAAEHAVRAIEKIRPQLKPAEVLNLNVPILDQGPPKGERVVPLSPVPLVDEYEVTPDLSGHPSYMSHQSSTFRDHPEGSDVQVLWERFVTLTPIRYNWTDQEEILRWRSTLDES